MMTRTPSNMIALGTKAPYFSLEDTVTHKMVHFNEANKQKVIVICFICNHCPYVKLINKEFAKVAREYIAKGAYFIAINSNDYSSYPDDSPEKMRVTAQQEGYSFPYLIDETQEIAQAYHAACTPDFFVFNQQHELIYRGQFDDARPGNNIPVTGSSLKQALDCALTDQPLNFEQKPSLGCNIKWKNED